MKKTTWIIAQSVCKSLVLCVSVHVLAHKLLVHYPVLLEIFICQMPAVELTELKHGRKFVCVDDMNFNLYAFLLALFIDLLGIPLVAVASNSLYSKITAEETQGSHSVCLLLTSLYSE